MNDFHELVSVFKKSRNENSGNPLDDQWKQDLMNDLRMNHFGKISEKILYVDFNDYAWKFAACGMIVAGLLVGTVLFQSGSTTGYLYASVFWDQYTSISMMS